MYVGQAVFASDSGRRDGTPYLVSRSRDVDGRMVEHLVAWTPSYFELSDRMLECINFFRPAPGMYALSRSVIVHPPNRAAGNGRLVTTFVLLGPDQLLGFDNNVCFLASTLRSMGHLFLQPCNGTEMPALDIPATTIFKCSDWRDNIEAVQAETITRAIEIHRKVAIFTQGDAMAFMCSYLAHLPQERRTQISFSTGLRVADQRPFNLHFFPRQSDWVKRELVHAQVRTLTLDFGFAATECGG